MTYSTLPLDRHAVGFLLLAVETLDAAVSAAVLDQAYVTLASALKAKDLLQPTDRQRAAVSLTAH
ncbi:MAG: hypothetical protein OXC63_00620 [Aestuariivita sp.]|nr:hypothetical protein [Aestuariivita sp.]